MVTIIYQSQHFTLHSTQQKRNSKSYRKIYVLAVKLMWDNYIDLSAVRDLVDPHRNRGGKYSTSWKFRHKIQAEQLYTMLVLRWG